MTTKSTPSVRRSALTKLGPLLGLVCVWLLFAVLRGETFLPWDNQRLMLLQTAVVGIAAIGATLVIVSGGIDLSVGSSIALSTVVIAHLHNSGLSPFWAALVGVLCGAVLGLGIGAIVVGHLARVAAVLIAGIAIYLSWDSLGGVVASLIGVAVFALGMIGQRFVGSVPLRPFIVTLALWGGIRGFAKVLGDNQPVYLEDSSWLTAIMTNAPTGVFAFLAPAVWILIALAIFMSLVLRYTRFGRHVFAVGSNEATARLCGVNVNRTKIAIYVIAVACAGLAGVLQFGDLSMGDPTTAEGLELKIIAAVVIGGASLTGGEGSIFGTIIGALIMTVVDNGCTKLGLENSIQEMVTGAIILVAVLIDRLRHRGGN